MQPFLNRLRGAGASDVTIDIFLLLFIIFTFLLGAGAATVLFYEIVTGKAITPILVGIVTTILGVVSALGIASHQTQAINGSAAAAASNTAASLRPAIDSNTQLISQLMAALMQIQTTQAQTVATTASTLAQNTAQSAQSLATSTSDSIKLAQSTIASTQTVQENTEATERNTATMVAEGQPSALVSIQERREPRRG